MTPPLIKKAPPAAAVPGSMTSVAENRRVAANREQDIRMDRLLVEKRPLVDAVMPMPL
jgi:hypothetical protein